MQKNNFLQRLNSSLVGAGQQSSLLLSPTPYKIKGEKSRDLSPLSLKTPFKPRLPGNGFKEANVAIGGTPELNKAS